MTAGLSIGIDAVGGSAAEAELKRVAKGADAIATAEHKAAAAAKARGAAQHAANQHGYRTAHASGDHGGFMHSLHIAGTAGGEIGHIGHTLARAGRFGAVGLGVAAAGFAMNLAVENAVEAGRKAGELEEAIQSLGAKLKAAGKAADSAALGLIDRDGFSLRRIGNAGGSIQTAANWQRQGVGPGALAGLMGGRNWQLGAQAAAFSANFGSDPNAVASAITEAGGVRDGQNYKEIAKYYSERIQHRRISALETEHAIDGGAAVGDTITRIQGYGLRSAAAAYATIDEGGADRAGAERVRMATNPRGAAMKEAFTEATEQSKVLNAIADNTSLMAQAWQTMMHQFGGEASSATKAKEFVEKTTQAMMANRSAAGE